MNLNIHLAWRKTIFIRTFSLNKISFEFIFVLKGSINVIDIFIWFWKKHIQWYYYCFLYKIEQKLLLLLLSCFSRVRLCDPIDGSPPGSPVTGILQARTLEWVAISFSHWKVLNRRMICTTVIGLVSQNFQLIKRELMELLFVNTNIPVVFCFFFFLPYEQIHWHFFI